MVEITETDDSKVNSHHRYTGAVRVDFPRDEDTVDVDEETAQTAVSTYETVEFADDVGDDDEQTGQATEHAQAGKKSETQAHQNAARTDTSTGPEATEDADTRESRAPHAQTEANTEAATEAAAADTDDDRTPGEPP